MTSRIPAGQLGFFNDLLEGASHGDTAGFSFDPDTGVIAFRTERTVLAVTLKRGVPPLLTGEVRDGYKVYRPITADDVYKYTQRRR